MHIVHKYKLYGMAVLALHCLHPAYIACTITLLVLLRQVVNVLTMLLL